MTFCHFELRKMKSHAQACSERFCNLENYLVCGKVGMCTSHCYWWVKVGSCKRSFQLKMRRKLLLPLVNNCSRSHYKHAFIDEHIIIQSNNHLLSYHFMLQHFNRSNNRSSEGPECVTKKEVLHQLVITQCFTTVQY